jgi:uncharacterized protein (DUF983 family)
MPPEPGFVTVVARGLRRRCPACGDGRISRGFLRLEPFCPACGWRIEREPGAVTGAMYLISILTQLFAAALFFLVWLLTDWTPATKLAVALPLIAVFSLVALPLSKSVWVAVDYYTDIRTGETRRPGYRATAYVRDEAPDAGAREP